ncbi:phosphatidylinositol-4-phosphate 3-kinase catalytic subunit Pi3K68D [Arctopsyche grandis]|uniref:phosphatidylinositol-4-phosphate 3-kinase catalytic subunit Pi3K68D n=1 Tax=Arctopsyche grandis TaxID=121162 RepID=UPI00406D9B65
MSEYERHFQAELERAQALSLESLALDQFRRQRNIHSASPTSENECDGPIRPTRSRSNSSGCPPLLPPPPRRPARRARNSPHPEGIRSTSSSPTPCESKNDDLISFTAPSSTGKAHQEFKEHIHRLSQQSDLSALVHVPKGVTKLSRSNSSASSHSTHSIIPYPSGAANLNNFMNPVINYPASSPYLQYNCIPNATPQMESSRLSMNNPPYGFSNLYPNLANVSPLPYVCQTPTGSVTSNPPIYPQLSTFSRSDSLFSNNLPTLPPNLPTSVSVNAIDTELNNRNSSKVINNNGINCISKSRSVDLNTVQDMNPSHVTDGVRKSLKEKSSHLPYINVPMSSSGSPIVTQPKAVVIHRGPTPLSGKSVNLIDLAPNSNCGGVGNIRVSVLEAFDPLMANLTASDYMYSSECSSSIYDEYDPLDFLYGEVKNSKEAPVYATVNRRDTVLSPLPSPPPRSLPTATPVIKRNKSLNSKLYESVVLCKTRKYESELVAFLEMVKRVRSKYKYSDSETNPGYVISSKSEGQYNPGTSIKLLVYHQDRHPVTFTCDVESTVEHVILHVVCELEGEIREDISGYTLRVWGLSEYLTPGSSLSEYNYVRQCFRLEKDIELSLQSTRDTSLARSERDDIRDSHLVLDKILPNQSLLPPISFHDLSILLETLERELSRVSSNISEGANVRLGATAQAVKAICALLGGVETQHVSTALRTLIHACDETKPDSSIVKPEIISETGEYCDVSLRKATIKDTIGLHCQRLREAVRGFISIYCRANGVDFELEDNPYSPPVNSEGSNPLTSVTESTIFFVEGIHRHPVFWNHDDFIVRGQIYHGTRLLKGSKSTQPVSVDTSGFYPRIMFETWLTLDDINIAKLPKEARLVITLSGRTLSKPDSQSGNAASEKEKAADSSNSPEKQESELSNDPNFVHVELEELGWSSIQLIDFDGMLVSGGFILPLWPVSADKRLGPSPDVTECPPQPHPLINIEIPSYSTGGVHWKDYSEEIKNMPNSNRHSFEALDSHTQQQLMHLVEQGPYQKMPLNCREILWEKRHYLVGIPGALPLVLQASVNWDAIGRWQLMQLLEQWTSPTPYDALHLLLPCFPDEGVRAKAVEWLAQVSGDTLMTLMPQLCLAIRYERFIDSPLVELLLSRALESPRFAHCLYWQLVHNIPGNSPNSSEEFLGISLDKDSNTYVEPDESIVAASRWVRRSQIILRSLLAIVGNNLSDRLLKQQILVKGLADAANAVKRCKESQRNIQLEMGIKSLVPIITSSNVCLPLSISQEVFDIDIKSCSYFPSNTLPLKINFIGNDNTIIPAIFKVGDDLLQDSLVLQVIRVMDQLWLKEGLDLRMVTFDTVPTQHRKGIIEMVCNAETLRAIQVEWGLTGSFKDKPIAEWLAKHNPSELEYERAVTNFTASCAGYSVATYLLGICDRHNDNIMLKTSGHLFHIDFGKFLGDAQMFGNFKRDRTPFVLTPDMAYVINGGERPSQRFHHFIDLCCTAFNIIRKHHNLILHMFSLMATSGIAGVSATAVGYVQAALLPGQTSAEASAAFAKLIHSALKSRFTPINFFLHNLAQFRVGGDQPSTSTELLSFMPRTYTMEQEGKIVNADVIGYEKRYEPEKYYVYSLKIQRQDQATPFIVYRSYKHFTELYQKICIEHPLASVHRLPVGLYMGRMNTRQAAERRFGDIKAFIDSLFKLAPEIAHSKLVYTFFHPLLRDQQDVEPQRIKNRSEIQRNTQEGVGALKISLHYSAEMLSVMILHAQSLPMTPQGVPPSPYVKVYLLPDPSKETKRKTRVLKRNCHPSFMEMLEYRLPLEIVRARSLQVTVWHHDSLQENQFLGGVLLPLHSMPLNPEITEWFPLQYMPR